MDGASKQGTSNKDPLASVPPATPSAPSEATALQRYNIVSSLLSSDNAIFWTRSQLLMAGHAALLGFVANQLGKLTYPVAGNSWLVLGSVLVESAVGASLCVVWYLAIRSGAHWLAHWNHVLVHELEAPAFGSVKVRRGAPSPRPRTRHIAYFAMSIFAVTWAALLLLSLLLLVHKWRWGR